MRNINLEAAIFKLYTSSKFFDAAAHECDNILKWFGTLAKNRGVTDFGRNNQIYDNFKQRSNEFRRGAQLAVLGDYEPIWKTASYIRGDIRGIYEQPLHSWMSKAEYHEFEYIKIGRLTHYSVRIEKILNHAMTGALSFFDPDLENSDLKNYDSGFSGDEIIEWYRGSDGVYKEPLIQDLPDPIPNYIVDATVSCKTGDEVPWTGIWFPSTGLENHSLTFAVKGLRMQPAYRVIKTKAELRAEGVSIPISKTVAEATVWHPVIEAPQTTNANNELWAKAGQPCPREGMWQPTDPGVPQRYHQLGQPMLDLKSAHGLTVWRWMADR